MTGNEIYKMAIAFLYEDSGKNPKVQNYSVSFLNRMLAEAFRTENSIREQEGTEQLKKIPFLKDLSEDVPYHDEITRSAFVYGIAAHMYAEEQDNYRAEVCRAEYKQALNNSERGVWVEL